MRMSLITFHFEKTIHVSVKYKKVNGPIGEIKKNSPKEKRTKKHAFN